MRWLADECVPVSLVRSHHAAGQDVLYVAEMAAGCSDDAVIDQARRDQRLLLTEDKDFGDLVIRQGRLIPDVVLLRIDPARPTLKAARLAAAITQYGDELFGRYVVIDEGRMRARRLR
jgi:predicted nuclease of predicted toxin-antitoxin system